MLDTCCPAEHQGSAALPRALQPRQLVGGTAALCCAELRCAMPRHAVLCDPSPHLCSDLVGSVQGTILHAALSCLSVSHRPAPPPPSLCCRMLEVSNPSSEAALDVDFADIYRGSALAK